ncbi:MAG TPA: glutaredoxin family protein [Steroidobacteraceae bacterium]
MPPWRVYTRPGCTLCEEFISELAWLLGPNAARNVQVIDISGDDDLERLYGARVPVLTVGDEVICTYHVDREQVLAHLEGAIHPADGSAAAD